MTSARTLRILVVADASLPVPPPAYGGAERIVDLCCRALAGQGHQVHLVAAAGSQDYGAGVTPHRRPTSAWLSRAYRKTLFQFLSLRAARGADVILNHGRLDYLEALYRRPTPMVHWFHNPMTRREVPYLLSRKRSRDTLVAVSRAQVRDDPHAARFEIVPNALDLAPIPFSLAPAAPPYVLFLGRLVPDKGVHLAIAAARQAGVRLVIAGIVPKNDPRAEAFFAREIRPHLGPNCDWVGPYDAERRNRLVAGATALLFPVQAPEAFGLVMIEAMAGGTPVIALRREATPEIVTDGENGFLCDDVAGMAAAIARIGQVSRRACRESAERRFSLPVFAERLDALIHRAAGTVRGDSTQPADRLAALAR